MISVFASIAVAVVAAAVGAPLDFGSKELHITNSKKNNNQFFNVSNARHPRTTYKSEMTANNSSAVICAHLAVHAVVPIREGKIVQPRASRFLDETDHVGSKGLVGHRGCRPELPVCQR